MQPRPWQPNQSSYHQVKSDALHGVPNYSYFVGTKYGQIPETIYGNGYQQDDLSHKEADYDARPINVPNDPQSLYGDHKDLSTGYAMWTPDEIRTDIAPYLMNETLLQWGRIGLITTGTMSLRQSLGFDLPGEHKIEARVNIVPEADINPFLWDRWGMNQVRQGMLQGYTSQ
jgi:hypothetical protein